MDTFGEQAFSRFQALMRPGGIVQHVGCAYGNMLRAQQCAIGWDTEASCSKPIKGQEVIWPLVSVVYRITPGNGQELADLVANFRTSEAGHLPAMTAWATPNTGAFLWGTYGAQSLAKVVPCSQMPEGVLFSQHPCDAVNGATG